LPGISEEGFVRAETRRRGGIILKDIDEISGQVLDVSIKLHRELGPGLMESVYESILGAKLERLGYSVDRQKPIDIQYDGLIFKAAFRIDLLIEDRLLVEIKSIDRIGAVHAKQLLTTSG
jgi:iron complex transport system substrate-binding protein